MTRDAARAYRRLLLRAILLVPSICCTLLGCPSRDNPYDPGRCDPPCAADEMCFEGACLRIDGGPPLDGAGDTLITDDGGAPDQLPDATPAGPAIVYKRCKGGAVSQTSSTTMSTIECTDGPLEVTVTANGTDKFLFILNVPDTWLECELGDFDYHRGTAFRLSVGDDILTEAGFTAPHGQRLPVTLVATKVLPAGEHTIAAGWRLNDACPTAGALKHGGYPSHLVVIRADPQDLQGAYGPSSAQSIAAGQDWTDLGIPSITIPEPGGDYLLILTTTPAYGTKNGPIYYHIDRVRDGVQAEVAHRYYDLGAVGQSFPVAVVAATNLSGGDVIRAQWKSLSSSTTTMISVNDTIHAGWLVALRTPKGIVSSERSPKTWTTTISKSAVAVPNLPLLEVPSTGGPHLLALQAQINSCAYAPYYYAGIQLHVDGVADVTGVFSAHGNSNIQACQSFPMALFGVKELAAGTHNLTAEWFTTGSLHDNGRVGMSFCNVLALTR